MRRLPLSLAVIALLAAPAAAPAKDTLKFFRSPSGNIGCLYAKSAGSRPSLRCDVRQIDNAPKRPKSCDLDWGHAFGVSTKGRARRLCVGDTAIDPSSEVIPYGTPRRFGKFRCTVKRSGVRCVARSGHGFKLSRQTQKLF